MRYHGVRLVQEYAAIIAAKGFNELPIRVHKARLAGATSIAHKGTFDRLLIAHVQVADKAMVSKEARFDSCTVNCFW